jgi:dephospho-CoA kinase
MRIIGLTGGTGSGKSHVGSMLKERHAYIADADVIAHEIIEKEK